MTWHTGNKRLLWQHLNTMVTDKIRKMSVKGVKLKSESYFSISPGVLELWRKTLRGGGGRIPPPPVQIGLRLNNDGHISYDEMSVEIMVYTHHCKTIETKRPSIMTLKNLFSYVFMGKN